MEVKRFVKEINECGISIFAGVPDSLLKHFCDYINSEDNKDIRHFVTVNEGAAVGLAVGSYLSTGRPACVYMQNSGLGNIVNPVTSIANSDVYGIPMLFIIGWRGEPGKVDEPQHAFMGKITKPLLQVLDIEYSEIDNETTDEELKKMLKLAKTVLDLNKQYAFVIKKGAFDSFINSDYKNEFNIVRESAIAEILLAMKPDDVIVSTTGKISREVYEQSEKLMGHHQKSFLTVGGMGYASMIAYGIAIQRKDKRVFCLDGDGAALMHMGNLAFLGQRNAANFVHICFNNRAHESVGGMPTGAVDIKISNVAKSCGYSKSYVIYTTQELESVLSEIEAVRGSVFIEICVSMASRSDLGRPKERAVENKKNFMKQFC